MHYRNLKTVALTFMLCLAIAVPVGGQTFTITFQGSLNNAGTPANGNYDFEFLLYDALGGGNQLGSTVSRNNVAVSNGTFAVSLDFGPTVFSGAARFLEIRVRSAGAGGMTILVPRRQVESAPYAIRSFSADLASNSTSLGGVAANQFVVTTDTRMSDARQPVAGSGDYIQNRGTPQPSTNFNISGNGTVGGTLVGNTVRANTQFNIGNSRILSRDGSLSNLYLGVATGNDTMTGTANTFLGDAAGQDNTTGFSNTFVGNGAGRQNTTGNEGAFFGYGAGADNTTGSDNSFFGRSAGNLNTTGSNNSFFGFAAGYMNNGNSNSFFGHRAGYENSTGGGNSFFGYRSGTANTTGITNSFFGYQAGESNTTGQNNTFFGANAGAANTTSLGNSFFGANSGAVNVGQGNSFFGASTGLVNTTGFNNSFFGTVAGVANTTGNSNSFFGHWAGHDNETGTSNAFFGAFAGESNTLGGHNVFVGRAAGESNTLGANNTFVGRSAGENSLTGFFNTFVGANSGAAHTGGGNNTLIGSNTNLSSGALDFATAIGAGAVVSASNTIQLGRANRADRVFIPGQLVLDSFTSFNSIELCTSIDGEIGTCSSSLRYKSDVQDFTNGLDVLRRLRPISFNWKNNGLPDLGFGAEEVDEIEPRLVVRNKSGQIEGVKYNQITTVLVNAIKEQQQEIEDLRREVGELKALVREMASRSKQEDPR